MYSTFWNLQQANANLFFKLASKGIDVFKTTTDLAAEASRSMMNAAHEDAERVAAEQRRADTRPDLIAAAFPSPDKAQSYAREMFELACDVQAGLAQWTREQLGAQQESMRTLAEQVGRVSDSAARTADEFSGVIRQNAENVSSLAERSARDARDTASTVAEAGKTGRQTEQPSDRSSGQGAGSQKH